MIFSATVGKLTVKGRDWCHIFAPIKEQIKMYLSVRAGRLIFSAMGWRLAVKGWVVVDWLTGVPDCRARSVGVGLSPRGLSRSTQNNVNVLSVTKFTANLYCICLGIALRYTHADAVQICGNFWDTQ